MKLLVLVILTITVCYGKHKGSEIKGTDCKNITGPGENMNKVACGIIISDKKWKTYFNSSVVNCLSASPINITYDNAIKNLLAGTVSQDIGVYKVGLQQFAYVLFSTAYTIFNCSNMKNSFVYMDTYFTADAIYTALPNITNFDNIVIGGALDIYPYLSILSILWATHADISFGLETGSMIRQYMG